MAVGQGIIELESEIIGSPDAEEIANMTDPNDPKDQFRILSFAPAEGFDAVINPVFDITLRTFPGLNYALALSDSLESFQTIPESSFTATNHTHTLRRVLSAQRAFVRAYRGTKAAE